MAPAQERATFIVAGRITSMKRIPILVLSVLSLALAPITHADAGTGASQACSDGTTYGGSMEVPILGDPVTLGLEAGPYGSSVVVIVCFSTTRWGDTGTAIAGGHAALSGPNNDLWCRWDDNTAVGVGCFLSWGNPIAVIVDPRVQSNSGWIGVTATAVRVPACIEGLRLHHRTGSIGPFNVGVC